MREKFTIAKLLIALKNRNECQMLSLNSSEQADLIPEIEKLLSENEKLQQENRNAKVDNQELYKEIEKLKSRDKILNGWNDDAAKEIEKLKSENENLKELDKLNDELRIKVTVILNNNAAQNQEIEKLKSENEELTEWNDMLVKNLSKIPNVITKIGDEHAFCHATFDGFIKNALAKELEREKWYVVKCTDFDKPMPAYINSDGQWICDGYCFDDNDINVLNTTPIDLGETK